MVGYLWIVTISDGRADGKNIQHSAYAAAPPGDAQEKTRRTLRGEAFRLYSCGLTVGDHGNRRSLKHLPHTNS